MAWEGGTTAPRLRKSHPEEGGGCDKYKVWRCASAWLVQKLKCVVGTRCWRNMCRGGQTYKVS